MGKLSLRCQRTVASFHPADITGCLQKAGTEEAQGPIPAGRPWREEGQGRTRVDMDPERTLYEEGLNPFDNFDLND